MGTHRGYEVGGSGGHSGLSRGRGEPESFGEEGPHHGITGEQQTSAQQPQGDVQLAGDRFHKHQHPVTQTHTDYARTVTFIDDLT